MGILDNLIASGECTLYHDYRSGSFRDFSGNGNHGTPTSCALTGKGGLKPTSITGGYVLVEDCNPFNASLYGTIFVLAENVQLPSAAYMVGYASDAGSKVTFRIGAAGNRYYLEDESSASTSTTAEYWTVRSMAVTFQDSAIPDFYTDGSYFDDGNIASGFDTGFGNGDLYVGVNELGNQDCNFSIQAVVCANTKLTAGQISDLHDELLAKKWPSKVIGRASARSLTDTTKTGLVSAYDWKNGSFVDLVGSNDGSRVGSIDTTKTRLGNACKFNGVGCLLLGTGFNSFTNIFASFWYLHESVGSTKTIFSAWDGASDRLNLRVDATNTLDWFDDVSNNNQSCYSTILVPGRTYHIVVGINDANLLKMWIDGVPSDNDLSAIAGFETINGNVYVGSAFTTLSYSITGSISSFEIFNTDLTDSDAIEIYQRAKRIVSYFDEGITASEAVFSSGFVENTPFEVQSGSFKIVDDGSGKYLECVTDGVVSFPMPEFAESPQNAAYGTWKFSIYKQDADDTKIAFVSNDENATTSGYSFRSGGSDTYSIIRNNGTAAVVTGVGSVPVDQWVDLRITRAFNEEFKVYLNGSLDASDTDGSPVDKDSDYITVELDSGSRIGLTGDYRMWWSPIVQAP